MSEDVRKNRLASGFGVKLNRVTANLVLNKMPLFIYFFPDSGVYSTLSTNASQLMK